MQSTVVRRGRVCEGSSRISRRLYDHVQCGMGYQVNIGNVEQRYLFSSTHVGNAQPGSSYAG